jgi:hypothetical protein
MTEIEQTSIHPATHGRERRNFAQDTKQDKLDLLIIIYI